MIRMGAEYLALSLALAGFAVGCGASKGDPQAEAPPAAKVEHEQDVNVVKVDHPEQFPLFTAIEYAATSQLVATGVGSAKSLRPVLAATVCSYFPITFSQ